ncbi:hypothetical protein ACIOEX_26765, partial [Streptomyces sp. NPDC087850]
MTDQAVDVDGPGRARAAGGRGGVSASKSTIESKSTAWTATASDLPPDGARERASDRIAVGSDEPAVAVVVADAPIVTAPDPEQPPPPVRPRPAPRPVADGPRRVRPPHDGWFFGRQRELKALRGDSERAGLNTISGRKEPRARVLLIAGRPGSGRTTLAQELARR